MGIESDQLVFDCVSGGTLGFSAQGVNLLPALVIEGSDHLLLTLWAQHAICIDRRLGLGELALDLLAALLEFVKN